MNNPMISQINRVTDCMEEFPSADTQVLISQLSDPNDNIRMLAREALTCIGGPAIPELLQAINNTDTQLRWEIIKVLENIQNTDTIPVLVEQLKNHHAGVRWAASNALIGFRRSAIPAILEALMKDSDSIWLRQSAHHILHVFKDSGNLTAAEGKVYRALEDVEPGMTVPWAAERALESLRHHKN
jgi:HEAT repeat protein